MGGAGVEEDMLKLEVDAEVLAGCFMTDGVDSRLGSARAPQSRWWSMVER